MPYDSGSEGPLRLSAHPKPKTGTTVKFGLFSQIGKIVLIVSFVLADITERNPYSK